VGRHSAAAEEYFKPERRGSENCGRDLEKEYRHAKERLEHLRLRKTPQFAILKHNVINPEREKARQMTLKRAFDIKVPPVQSSHSHSLQIGRSP
jgi:hypothetical protein